MNTDNGKRRRTDAAPTINVTPFIDILLVLLIIFMVLTPLKPSRFKALVPEPPPEDAEVNKSPRTLVVEVDNHLNIKLIRGSELIAEGVAGDASAVASRLAEEFAERKARGSWRLDAESRSDLTADQRVEKTVFIKAPRSVGYGDVAKVIDDVKGAGAAPIGLQTDELVN
ncbi:MAG TPA: biopolymer transporter ExbD [Pyrinomonadaceae bacterium]|jgi:biopolymer transport protein ExbD